MKIHNIVSLLGILLVSACSSKHQREEIVALQLVDRNGVNETINSKERLAKYDQVNFLEPQPYQKVVRMYKQEGVGGSHSIVTSYHDNGQIWQSLSIVNGRALGEYSEWFSNGKLRIKANVIEGVGDLTDRALSTWVFDRDSYVYDEKGNLLAIIYYNKGELAETSTYYHSNGKVRKQIPFVRDKQHGIAKEYDEEGALIGTTQYQEGIKEGISRFIGNQTMPAREEYYKNGCLLEGKYFDFEGSSLCGIKRGNGMRPVFENGKLIMEHEYQEGEPRGLVNIYSEGSLESHYYVKEGLKDGEEVCYWSQNKIPKLMIHWSEDEIHGVVKSWYEDGSIESEKEMSHNKKHGKSFAWYKDGSLMLVEDYEDNKLIHGKYMRRGENNPCSIVANGTGTVSLHDGDGIFLKKIEYQKGGFVD